MENYEGRRVKVYKITPEVFLNMFKNEGGGIWAAVEKVLPNDAEIIGIEIGSFFGGPPMFCLLVESSEYEIIGKNKLVPEGAMVWFLNIPECDIKFNGELSLNEYIASKYPKGLKAGS